MLDALEQVDDLVARHTNLDALMADRIALRALERLIEILSEASRHLPQDFKDRHPSIEWRRVADVGNWLRHAYQSIDPRLLMNIVTHHLDHLRTALLAERARLHQTPSHDP
jgi:uncharacterized protein with HEPN domain